MVAAEEIDYLCMQDGHIYNGPDTGDTIPKPAKHSGWPVNWKGHPISHGICPEHAAEMDPHERMNIWGQEL